MKALQLQSWLAHVVWVYYYYTDTESWLAHMVWVYYYYTDTDFLYNACYYSYVVYVYFLRLHELSPHSAIVTLKSGGSLDLLEHAGIVISEVRWSHTSCHQNHMRLQLWFKLPWNQS